MDSAAKALRSVLSRRENVISSNVIQNMDIKAKDSTAKVDDTESKAKGGKEDLVEIPVYDSKVHVKLGQQMIYLSMLYTFISLATPDKKLDGVNELLTKQFGSVFKDDVGGQELSKRVNEKIEYLRSIIGDSLGEMLRRKPVIDIEDVCDFMDKCEVKEGS